MSDNSHTQQMIDEASRWLVLLRSGTASDAQNQAYRAWRAQDPRHEQLCATLEKNLGAFQVSVAQGIGSDVLHRTLQSSSRRKLLQGALAGAGVMFGAGLVSSRLAPLSGLTADVHTATGVRRRLPLDDGSELFLNARSVADLELDQAQRLVRLHSGELFARLGRRAGPLRVQTPHGLILTQHAQLLVRQSDSGTRVWTFDAPVQINAFAGGQVELPAGQQIDFAAGQFGVARPARWSDTAWIDGRLELHDRPLSEAIEALRPYRAGLLNLDPSVAALRVSGLFNLDDSDRVLDTLERTLPIRVVRRTALWITVVAA